MTHPTQTLRGDHGPHIEPGPIELQPRGGCPGRRLVGRTCAKCSIDCARFEVGGPQIAPALVLVERVPKCVNWIPHPLTVLPLRPGEQAASFGGSANVSLQGAPA